MLTIIIFAVAMAYARYFMLLSVLLTILWVAIIYTYLRRIDNDLSRTDPSNSKSTEANRKYIISLVQPSSPLVALTSTAENDLSKDIFDEQLSPNKVPEVDLIKLAKVNDANEQVICHFSIISLVDKIQFVV